MNKLRACPFCGSEDVRLCSGNWDSYAICLDCGVEGPRVEDDSAVEQEERNEIAVKLWNRRTYDRVMLDVSHELKEYNDRDGWLSAF